jgi:hypothetical protein
MNKFIIFWNMNIDTQFNNSNEEINKIFILLV